MEGIVEEEVIESIERFLIITREQTLHYSSSDIEFQLILLEVLPETLPCAGDFRTKVQIDLGGFAGQNDLVWFANSDWEIFCSELKSLHDLRKGKASICAMSPDDFRISLESTDRKGTILCEGYLSRQFLGKNQKLSFCFDLESEYVNKFLTDLVELKSSP